VIYKITAPNGKGYIGQTVWFTQRMAKHRSCKFSKCPAISAAIRKYGWDAMKVEILVDNCPEEQLDSLEIALIAEHNTRYPSGYNLTDGGDVNPAKEGEGHKKLMAMHASGEIKAAQRIGWAKPGVREKASASHKKRCREDGGRQARQGSSNLVTGGATAASHTDAANAKRVATWEAKRKAKLSELTPEEATRVMAQSKRKNTSYADACVAAGGVDALRKKRREWARLRRERGGR
tara:strand:+ start:74 stop:778 length:705 start_codon:yes stop_codon:yes gene_type:complete